MLERKDNWVSGKDLEIGVEFLHPLVLYITIGSFGFTKRKWSSSAVAPMLFANRRTSLFSHETSCGGYSKPTPGPLILIQF